MLGTTLALVAGCASQPPLATLSDTQMVSDDTAFAYPGAGGPAITAILEKRYANATQQDILLATSAHTSGQNMLRVQIFGPVDQAQAGQTHLREGYLPIGDVGAEMRQLFPGVRMARSPYYVQNRYGPFGYAAGRSVSGDTCIYGWQRLSSTGAAQTWIGNKGSIQIRLRLCDQKASEQQLLKAMYDFTIKAYFKSRNWNPYGAPNPPDATLGKAGAPVYPIGATQFATVTSPLAAEAPARRDAPRRKRQAAEATPPPPALPAPIGPTVPAPPVADNEAPLARTVQPIGLPGSRAKATPGTAVPLPPCGNGTGTGCN